MVVLYHESLQPCHSCPIAFVARSLAIHLLPFSFPWKICVGNTKNIQKSHKYPQNRFRPFLPPSDVSLFHTRLSTQEKIPSVFVLLSHSLNLSVNEIEVPFTNSILVKNGTRQAILLLFTLIKGFELASRWYNFMTFSDRLD